VGFHTNAPDIKIPLKLVDLFNDIDWNLSWSIIQMMKRGFVSWMKRYELKTQFFIDNGLRFN
jgi:hypothetical protein